MRGMRGMRGSVWRGEHPHLQRPGPGRYRRPMVRPRGMWMWPRWGWGPGMWGMGCLAPILGITIILGMAFLRLFF